MLRGRAQIDLGHLGEPVEEHAAAAVRRDRQHDDPVVVLHDVGAGGGQRPELLELRGVVGRPGGIIQHVAEPRHRRLGPLPILDRVAPRVRHQRVPLVGRQ